ncbi:2-C-methyl-D-erythritol 2,4-cyclodiphosphate synthase [Clostridia bacterium]|nr:2-C-methyl-D-erythritol 2,4-cyclodiphosphate synthase [Clostridia bacterium]
MMRIGIGYDAHRLVIGRKLILGGVCIDYEKGLLGHSDADVLVHAVIDALLGAAKLGDIGKMFPDSDEAYKDVSSLLLLTEAAAKVYESSYYIENIDCVIIAEKPKLAAFIPQMEENMAKALNITPDKISVKATTEEGMGFTGTGDGICAQAACLLERREMKFIKL